MYQDFYQLERAPFNTTPDPAFFYASPVHQEALAAIAYGVENRKGFISLIGEVGTGKTTVLRTYIGSSELENTRIIYLFNPNVTFDDLLVMVLRELEIEHEIPRDQTRRIDLLHRVLVREYKRGNNVVLIIDEAQNVPPETLESIRLLTNIETDSEKLIQIILCGQPELKRLLAMQSLRQLRERIAVKTELRALTKSEAIEYIHHRLERARQPQDGSGIDRNESGRGRNANSIFTDDAINEVIRRTGGNPRAINILCDNALITGYGYQKYPIASPIIREIAKELDDGLPPKSGFSMHGDRSGLARVAGYGLAAIALIAFLAIGGMMLFRALFNDLDAQPQPVAQQVETTSTSGSVAANDQNGTAMPVEAQSESVNSESVNVERESTTTMVQSGQQTGTETMSTSVTPATPSTSSGVVTFDANQSAAVNTGQSAAGSTDAIVAESAPQPAVIPANESVSAASQNVTDVTAQIKPASSNDNPNQAAGSIPGADQTEVVSPQNPARVSSSTSSEQVGAIILPASSSRSESTILTAEPVVVAENSNSVAAVVSGSGNSDEYYAVRTVNQGDMLWNMVLDVYGVASPQIMEWLLDKNPQISNRNVINVGEEINFPNLPDRFLP